MTGTRHALFLLLLLTAFHSGCNWDSEEGCYPRNRKEGSCEYFNNLLDYCHSEGYPRLPNCDVMEYCTDYPEDTQSTGATSDTSSDDATDTFIGTADTNSIGDMSDRADTNTINDVATDNQPPDTSSAKRVCKKVCEGELIPCEAMSKSQCVETVHCEWYKDAATI